MSAPPFQYQELADPRVHTILNSTDGTEGPTTFTVLWTTSQFRERNPRTYKAVLAAFKEATDIVNGDKRAAADLYVNVERPKLTVDEVYKMITAPGMEYTITPSGVMQYADFMFAHGLIKVKQRHGRTSSSPKCNDLPGG